MLPAKPKILLVPWGGVVEDFLAPIGISRRSFAEQMTGGWLFGYAEALRRHGFEPVILGFSLSINRPERWRNPVTNIETIYLPQSFLYRILRRWPGDIDDVARLKCPNIAWLRSLVRYFATPRRRVRALLKNERISAILVQEYEYPRFDVFTGIGRHLGLPIFASYQGGLAPESVVERWIRRASIVRANGLIIASVYEAERVQIAYAVPKAKIIGVPNPLDIDLWRPQSRTACRALLRIPADAEVVVCHGRIDLLRKGIDLLLTAWRNIVRMRPGRDLRLHLIGSGQDDGKLAEILATNPLPSLRWVKRYVNDRDEMRVELGAADIYTLPSRHEGFPVAPLEAMACGLPIVAAAAPGVVDILPDGEASGGIVIPVGDAQALDDALGRVLDDDDLRSRLASRARPRVAEFASLDAVGFRLSAFLSDRSVMGLEP